MSAHWTIRLARLRAKVRATGYESLSRSERRQLRKLNGRSAGLEWRLLGRTKTKDGEHKIPRVGVVTKWAKLGRDANGKLWPFSNYTYPARRWAGDVLGARTLQNHKRTMEHADAAE